MTSEPTVEAGTPVAAIPEIAPPPAPRRRTGLLVAALVLTGLASGAIATFHLWRDQTGFVAAQGSFEVENLRAELSAATARIAQLEARPVVVGAAADTTRLDRLEQELKAAQAQPAVPSHLVADVDSLTKQVAEIRKTAADSATVLRLADRIDQTEAALRELQARRSSAAALLLAVGQLREALALGQSFDPQWRAVRVLAGDDGESLAGLDGIKDHAGTGIATRATLAQRFETLAPSLIRADILPEAEGWWRRTAERLLSLVTIRREDGAAAGPTTAAIVARAQAALARGDLAGGVAELESLNAAAADLARPWLVEAKARLEADRAVSALAAHALALAGVKP